MEKIQEMLFENKESIPNGLYVKLMDELKKSYITKNDNDFIKLTYTRIRPNFRKRGYEYSVDLYETSDLTIIIKKSDLKSQIHNVYYENIMTKIEALPFIPFWYDGGNKTTLFKDGGYTGDIEYIFETIQKDEPGDDDFDDRFNDEIDCEENKRKIKIKISVMYDIKYLITNVEKL